MESVVPWQLFRAGVTCSWRRARPALVGNPLLALIAGLLALALPVAAFSAGRRLSGPVALVLPADDTVALAFALSLAAGGAFVGAVLAALAPSEAALGAQVRAAPVSRLTTFACVTALPLLVAGSAALLLASAFLIPLTAQLPHASGATLVILTAWIAAAALGASCSAGVVGLARGSLAALASIAGVAAVWMLGTLVGGNDVLAGPFASVANVIVARDPAPAVPFFVLALAAAVGVAGWAFAAATLPPARAPRSHVRSVLPIPAATPLGPLVAALKRYVRRQDLRRQAIVVIAATSVAGFAADRLLALPPGFTGASAAALAVLGAAVFPLVSAGVDREAEWLWRTVPQSRLSLGISSALASLLVAAAVLAAAVTPLVLAGNAMGGQSAMVVAPAAIASGAALLAGAIVPWRTNRMLEQLAGLMLLAVTAGGAVLCLDLAARGVDTLGVAERLFVPLAAGAFLVAALVTSAAVTSRRGAA